MGMEIPQGMSIKKHLRIKTELVNAGRPIILERDSDNPGDIRIHQGNDHIKVACSSIKELLRGLEALEAEAMP